MNGIFACYSTNRATPYTSCFAFPSKLICVDFSGLGCRCVAGSSHSGNCNSLGLIHARRDAQSVCTCVRITAIAAECGGALAAAVTATTQRRLGSTLVSTNLLCTSIYFHLPFF